MPKYPRRAWGGVFSAQPSASLEVFFHEVQHTTMEITCVRGNRAPVSAIFKQKIGSVNVPSGPNSTAMSVGLHSCTSPSQACASTSCSQHHAIDPGSSRPCSSARGLFGSPFPWHWGWHQQAHPMLPSASDFAQLSQDSQLSRQAGWRC